METFEMPTLKELESDRKRKQAELDRIDADIAMKEELDGKRDAVKAEVHRRLKEAEGSAKAYVKAEGFNYAELMGGKKASSKSKGSSKPGKEKYRHPDDGRIAKHKGPKPQWVKEFIERGEEDKILISGWND
jgi:hypothetical protein